MTILSVLNLRVTPLFSQNSFKSDLNLRVSPPFSRNSFLSVLNLRVSPPVCQNRFLDALNLRVSSPIYILVWSHAKKMLFFFIKTKILIQSLLAIFLSKQLKKRNWRILFPKNRTKSDLTGWKITMIWLRHGNVSYKKWAAWNFFKGNLKKMDSAESETRYLIQKLDGDLPNFDFCRAHRRKAHILSWQKAEN